MIAFIKINEISHLLLAELQNQLEFWCRSKHSHEFFYVKELITQKVIVLPAIMIFHEETTFQNYFFHLLRKVNESSRFLYFSGINNPRVYIFLIPRSRFLYIIQKMLCYIGTIRFDNFEFFN